MSQSVAQSLVARPGAYDGTLMARERGREEERVVIDDGRLCDRFLIDDDEELARATERGLAAMDAAAEVESFPELGGSGYVVLAAFPPVPDLCRP